MKKILNTLATIAVLCAMVFLGGEWPENTPRKKVLAADGIAIAVLAAGGLYLKNEYDNGRLR